MDKILYYIGYNDNRNIIFKIIDKENKICIITDKYVRMTRHIRNKDIENINKEFYFINIPMWLYYYLKNIIYSKK